MVILLTMIMVNIHEAKAKLSEYLEAIARGERVLICKRNRPIAELKRIEEKPRAPRPIGGGPHRFSLPDSFFEPMPDEFLGAFEQGPVFPPGGSGTDQSPLPRAPRESVRRRRRAPR